MYTLCGSGSENVRGSLVSGPFVEINKSSFASIRVCAVLWEKRRDCYFSKTRVDPHICAYNCTFLIHFNNGHMRCRRDKQSITKWYAYLRYTQPSLYRTNRTSKLSNNEKFDWNVYSSGPNQTCLKVPLFKP